MPGRKTPLVTNEIYHVFNRGINRAPTFTNKRELARAVETVNFYRFANPPVRLSKYFTLANERRKEILQIMENHPKLVEIYSYCFMPNHFHFLLRQAKDVGISKFLSNFQNSYTRYFNTRNKRDGSLFLDQFKAVRIETEEQCLHVSRYIHLNPYTSYIVGSLDELKKYPWSSLLTYLSSNTNNSLVNTDLVKNFFKEDIEYGQFIFGQADYQRSLKEIEYLIIE